MIFSNTAVRSLSSLLVFAIATTTPSGVGGATTTNRKLSKNTASPTKNNLSSTAPPTSKCPTADLYYPLAINNTMGSPHIRQMFPAPYPEGGPEEGLICHDDKDGNDICIGQTYTNFNTLYADENLTKQVATLASTAKVVNVKDDGTQVHVITGSLVYDDTGTELSYGGYTNPNPKFPYEIHDLTVSGGTRDCALTLGFILFGGAGNNIGKVEFRLSDLKLLLNENSLGQPPPSFLN